MIQRWEFDADKTSVIVDDIVTFVEMNKPEVSFAWRFTKFVL